MSISYRAALAAFTFGAGLANALEAAPVQTVFSGVVSVDSAPSEPGIDLGTSFSFAVTYDIDTLTSTPIPLGGTGPSLFYTGMFDGALTIGSSVWTMSNINAVVTNNAGANGDIDGITFGFTNASGPASSILEEGQIIVRYQDDQFSDASFPTSFPFSNFRPTRQPIAQFEGINFDNLGATEFIQMDIQAITTGPVPTDPISPVPLPLSGLALITGLGGLGALRRRSRKSA